MFNANVYQQHLVYHLLYSLFWTHGLGAGKHDRDGVVAKWRRILSHAAFTYMSAVTPKNGTPVEPSVVRAYISNRWARTVDMNACDIVDRSVLGGVMDSKVPFVVGEAAQTVAYGPSGFDVLRRVLAPEVVTWLGVDLGKSYSSLYFD